MTATALLESCAHKLGVKTVRQRDGTLYARVPVRRPSGASIDYELELRDLIGGHIHVRERDTQRRLPSCCPERHINRDGSFCLYWTEGEGEARPVTDAATATDWWILLMKYLGRQETADRLRRWFGEARAHGAAARYQRTAEEIATRLGPQFRQDLRDAMLTVSRRRRHGRLSLQLFRRARLIAGVAPSPQGAIAADVQCPCDFSSGSVPIGLCGSHAVDLKTFMIALDKWRASELEFYRHLRDGGVKCCRTMDVCPLR
jgi:hypothetical protein